MKNELRFRGSIQETEQSRRKGRYFCIPARILIGLGIGLLVGNRGQGIRISAGFGIPASAFEKLDGRVSTDTVTSFADRGRSCWISILIGMFMILIGIGLIRAPLNFWPYVPAIFLTCSASGSSPADVTGEGGRSFPVDLRIQSRISGKTVPGVIGGFIRERGGPGFPGDRPLQE